MRSFEITNCDLKRCRFIRLRPPAHRALRLHRAARGHAGREPRHLQPQHARYKYDSGREGESMVIGFSPGKSDLTLYIDASMAAMAPKRVDR
jgi:hypothetical protein